MSATTRFTLTLAVALLAAAALPALAQPRPPAAAQTDAEVPASEWLAVVRFPQATFKSTAITRSLWCAKFGLDMGSANDTRLALQVETVRQ